MDDLIGFLDENAAPGMGWVCRLSTRGRGLRLHQTMKPVGVPHPNGGVVQPTAREAVQDFIESHANDKETE